jgi:hypothetical protein
MRNEKRYLSFPLSIIRRLEIRILLGAGKGGFPGAWDDDKKLVWSILNKTKLVLEMAHEVKGMFITGIGEVVDNVEDSLEDDDFSLSSQVRDDDHTAMTINDKEAMLEKYGAPDLGLTPEIVKKYFGNGARFRFYQRQRWLYSQRSNAGSGSKKGLKTILFDNEYEGEQDFPHMKLTEAQLKEQARAKQIAADKELFDLSDSEDDASVDSMNSLGNGSMVSELTEAHGAPNIRLQGGRVKAGCTSSSSSSSELNIPLIMPDPKSFGSSRGGDGEDEANISLSPRTKYIDNCLKVGINPRSSLIVRKKLSKQLCLKSHGLGDKSAMQFAESLKGAPYIHSINLADNRLTDEGMSPILASLVTLPTLYELNLSQNEVGPNTSQALAEYLGRDDCPLRKLSIAGACTSLLV